jgi:putative heme iron utilization protein
MTQKIEFFDLLRKSKTGTLSVFDNRTGYPLGTLVNVALDEKGRPLFLFSNLSRHTVCLKANSKASLLVSAPLPPDSDSLMQLRGTVIGDIEPVTDSSVPELKELYIRQHPYSAMYAPFGDFNLYRMQPQHVFVVGGFGRVYDFAIE